MADFNFCEKDEQDKLTCLIASLIASHAQIIHASLINMFIKFKGEQIYDCAVDIPDFLSQNNGTCFKLNWRRSTWIFPSPEYNRIQHKCTKVPFFFLVQV